MNVAPIAYLNGSYLPLSEARVSPMDRGFLFADSVYEVVPAYDGKFFRLSEHLQRLRSSLGAIRLDPGIEDDRWGQILKGLVERNGGGDLAVYLQVTRGAPAERNLAALPDPAPTVFAHCISVKGVSEAIRKAGVTVGTATDNRWGACHIKSTALLANVLALQRVGRDAVEVILIRDGFLTEGGSSNVFVVRQGRVVTPAKDHRILAGITRQVVLEILSSEGVPTVEKSVPETDLRCADEIWITSSTREVWPVTQIDGETVGTGRPGSVWQRVHERYQTIKRPA